MYSGLVISGGGVRGAKLLGVLQSCHIAGSLANVKLFVGTSVGSILCLLMIMRYTPPQIMRRMLDSNVLSDTRRSVTLERLLSGEEGIIDTRFMWEFLRKAAENAGFAEDVTLLQLRTRTGKSLCANVFDAQTGEHVVCTPDTHPHLSAVRLVLGSSSVPGIFPPVRIASRTSCLDGGILHNFLAAEASDMLRHGDNLLGVTISTVYHPPASSPNLMNKCYAMYALLRVPAIFLAAESGRRALLHRKAHGGRFDMCALDDASFPLDTDVGSIVNMYADGFDHAEKSSFRTSKQKTE